MRLVITALILCSLLSGCGGASFNKEARLALPDIREYSKETQIKAADELTACDCPMVIEMIKDYLVMRDQTRAALQ